MRACMSVCAVFTLCVCVVCIYPCELVAKCAMKTHSLGVSNLWEKSADGKKK